MFMFLMKRIGIQVSLLNFDQQIVWKLCYSVAFPQGLLLGLHVSLVYSGYAYSILRYT